MSTYGHFYKPKEPDNRIKILIFSLAAAILISILFSRCNSVKTATEIKISKLDSSSIIKVDSSSNQKNDITIDNHSLKFWDKESVIEFWPRQNAKIGKSSLGIIGLDTLNQDYADQIGKVTPYVIINDGLVELINQNIKSITSRSKGKDSSTSKTIDKSEISTDLKKEANTEVKTYNKDKTKNKESKRISLVFIAIGLFAVAFIGFLIAHKFRP